MRTTHTDIIYVRALGIIHRYILGSCCEAIAFECETDFGSVCKLIEDFNAGRITLDMLRASPGQVLHT